MAKASSHRTKYTISFRFLGKIERRFFSHLDTTSYSSMYAIFIYDLLSSLKLLKLFHNSIHAEIPSFLGEKLFEL